jgi:hypothetical protein
MKRFFALSLIALAAFVGCGGSADPKTAEAPKEQIDVQLEGTWQSQIIIDEQQAAKAKPEAVELIKSMKMEMTFRDDGTMSIVGETNGQQYEDENRWDLVDLSDNKLTIKSIAADGKEQPHDFYFNDSNSFDMPLSIDTAQVGALRFTRVR